MSHESYEYSPAPEVETELPAVANGPSEDAHDRAAEIAGKGDYDEILDVLRREKSLAQEVERVEREYSLDAIPFLNECDREMFAVLDLYDSGTARHCLETYRIAREKIEKEILPGTSFAGLIERSERVTLDQFYRACLFHDIGKVEVPRVVIGSSLHFRGGHPATARQALTPSELEEIQAHGYSGEETLMDIVRQHEAHSGEILAHAGYTTEAQLVARHHNYEEKMPESPFTVSVMHSDVDLADMLHIADVVQALQSEDRPYKRAFGFTERMRVVAEHAQDGKVSLAAAYLWLVDDVHAYDAQEHGTLDPKLAGQEARDLAFVRDFLVRTAGDLTINEGPATVK